MKRRLNRLVILMIVAALGLFVVGPAYSTSHTTTTTVTLTAVTGSRVLTVTDTAGSNLNAATVATGAGASTPFVTNVTDLLYKNETYTVNAELSNLYLWDGATYNCNVWIPSSDLGISFPVADAFGVSDVSALVDSVAFTLTGTLPNTADADVLSLLALTDEIAGTTSLNLAGLTRSGEGLLQETISGTVLDSVLSATDLPFDFSVGAGGAFALPADHSQCAGGDVSPTPHVLQAGGDNSGSFSLTDLATDVETALVDAAGVVGGDHLSESEILDAIFSDSELTAIQAAIAADLTGTVGAAWDGYVDSIVATLALDSVSVGSLIGQTGTYTSVPSLDVASTLNVAGTEDPPSGVFNAYQGEMIITLIPEPTWP